MQQAAAAEPGRRPAQQQFVGVDLRRPKGYAAPAANKVAAAGGEGDPCPRCESRDTKFCYYNNYNTSQPRHFCKGCRRYWTKGGTLRNVPVGGGTRKKSAGSASSPPSSYDAAAARPDKPKKPSKKKRRVAGPEHLALAAAKTTATDTTATAEIAAGATTTTTDAASEITTELVVPVAAAAEEDSLAHLFQPDDVALGLGLSDDFPAGKGLVDVVEPDSFEWPAAFDLGGACWGGLADPDPACLFLNLP